MEQRETQIIDGGQLAMATVLDKFYRGQTLMPDLMARRLFKTMVGIGESSLMIKYQGQFQRPYEDLVFLLWRLKELEQAELGSVANDMFKQSVPRNFHSLEWQRDFEERMIRVYNVDFQKAVSIELRLLIANTVTEFLNNVEAWSKPLFDLRCDEQFVVMQLEGDYSLYWQSLLQLVEKSGAIFQKIIADLKHIRLSSMVLGFPVGVNAQMVEEKVFALWKALMSLRAFRGKRSAMRKSAGRKELEEVIDEALIYPEYGGIFVDKFGSTKAMLGADGLWENAQMLKGNYLRDWFSREKRMLADSDFKQGLDGLTWGIRDIGVDLDYQERDITDLYPERVLGMIEETLQAGLFDEAEFLARVYQMAMNRETQEGFNLMLMYFQAWKGVSEDIEREKKLRRKRIFRLIDGNKS